MWEVRTDRFARKFMEAWFINAVTSLQACEDLSDIKKELVQICQHLEFDDVAYVVKLPQTFIRSSALVISTYSDEWLENYAGKSYLSIDPVVQHCFSSQRPYLWNRFKKGHHDKEIRKFAGEAQDFKLNDGISIGMPRYDGEAGLISLASERELVFTDAQYQRIVLYLNALQPYIHEKINQILQSNHDAQIKELLTEREKTCLLWVAEGKTANEISTILHISESTVVFHLKNATNKLQVTNRSQAIAKAVLLGLIVPQFSIKSVLTYHF